MTEWITIKQAVKLSQKSEATIRRLVKKNAITSKKDEFGRRMINENSLSDIFVIDQKNDSAHCQVDSVHYQNDRSLCQDEIPNLVKILYEQNDLLKGQMEKKDKQLAEFQERIRELHVLLKQSQEIQKQLPLIESQSKGVFSKILVKFGL